MNDYELFNNNLLICFFFIINIFYFRYIFFFSSTNPINEFVSDLLTSRIYSIISNRYINMLYQWFLNELT